MSRRNRKHGSRHSDRRSIKQQIVAAKLQRKMKRTGLSAKELVKRGLASHQQLTALEAVDSRRRIDLAKEIQNKAADGKTVTLPIQMVKVEPDSTGP